ncbi:GIY-YIG nuclease family protein [Paraclostridium bifermentans]|uniref:GIY-YIG nuclease family protein n=1 Tax=Paraclostridium bifermentans TaxID=1490 RepID=UPI001F327E95|nr:GIY-YIG nuclease family protein [Paraclostridium bifermentans]MCE9677451.1 GIY-YIG nuclease family protein [Paraclostridium bifermentans]
MKNLMYENRPGIYKIINTLNGKVYIGSTQNIRIRRNNHFTNLRYNRHHNIHLQNAYNKYGLENFEFIVLEYVDSIDYLLEKETSWIKKLKSNDNKYGYNSRVYTETNRGFKHSKETKDRISKAKKGIKLSTYTISEEMRKYKSELCKSQNLFQYHTEKTELKRRINSEKANKERGCPEWQRKAISQKNSGEGNGMAKLNRNKVIQIKLLLKEGKLTQQKIADMFSVSTRTVRAIKNGDRWNDIQI